MELQELIVEYSEKVVGDKLYALLLATAGAVITRYRYSTSYSPTGRWDEDAISGLSHDWIIDKLLRRGLLAHLLAANHDLRGLQRGLELAFRQHLLDQRVRTESGNLYRRTRQVFEREPEFHNFGGHGAGLEAWGLRSWQSAEQYQGSDEVLLRASFLIPGFPPVRYGAMARKASPILSGSDLPRFLAALFQQVAMALTLAQILLVYRYRFNLIESTTLSLSQPASRSDVWDDPSTIEDAINDPVTPEDIVVLNETVDQVFESLSERQRRVLLAYGRDSSTLTSVAQQIGCSKSTVENELHRVMDAIANEATNLEDADRIYSHLIERVAGLR